MTGGKIEVNNISADDFKYKSKSGKTITIREAKQQDAEAILAASSEVLVDAPYMLSTAEDAKKVKLTDMQKLIEAFTQNPNHIQFIAEAGNTLVGALEFKNGEKDKISHQGSIGMTVLPTYRNHGIGKALLHTWLTG
nr:GNAT family N-acetyltransferase [Virgibacillus salinus]